MLVVEVVVVSERVVGAVLAVVMVVDDELVWLVLMEVVDTVDEAGEGGKEFKLSWKRRRGLVCLEEMLEVGESGIVLTMNIPFFLRELELLKVIEGLILVEAGAMVLSAGTSTDNKVGLVVVSVIPNTFLILLPSDCLRLGSVSTEIADFVELMVEVVELMLALFVLLLLEFLLEG